MKSCAIYYQIFIEIHIAIQLGINSALLAKVQQHPFYSISSALLSESFLKCEKPLNLPSILSTNTKMPSYTRVFLIRSFTNGISRNIKTSPRNAHSQFLGSCFHSSQNVLVVAT